MALMFLLPAVPASALTFPAEIRGTIGGSNIGDGYVDRQWSGPIVLKRVGSGSTYKPASGTAITWNATLAAPCRGVGGGTLGHKQLVGELVIQHAREAGGYRWAIIIQPSTPSPMQVSGTCPAADGSSVPQTEDATATLVANSVLPGPPGHTHATDPTHFRGSGVATGPLGGGTQHWEWILKAASSLKAAPRAGGALRGATAHLDGSRSTPASQIKRYTWRFHDLPGACPAGASPRSGAHKQGRRVTIVVLCRVQADLTVTDAHGDSDTESTTVRVLPRKGSKWVTPFSHREKTGDSRTPHGSPQAVGDAFVSGDAGLNVSDCGRESSNSLIVCPLLEGRKSWLDHGYRLKQVNDPDGPFDNYFYVVSPSLSVKRAALISPNYLPGSTFYEYNKNKTDADVTGFLRAIKQHEGLGNGQPCTGHSGIMKMLVARPATNPRLVIEPDFGPSRVKTAEAADKHIHEVDARIDLMSADPLPDILPSRPIWAYDDYARAWKYFPAVRVPGNTLRQGCP